MTKLKAMIDEKVSIVLSVILLLFSFLIVMTLATDAWDGSVASSFASGSGTEASPYVINTEKQMGYFMNRLNAGITYEGKYIKLNANLDMTGGKWSVAQGTIFAGTFLGNNKTLTMDSNFLGTIAETGKVDWLNLKGSGTLSTPLLCYDNNGTIQNCRVQGNISRIGYAVGLLCSENKATGLVVNSCGFGSVIGEGNDSDCCVGWIGESEGTIKSCYAVVAVSGSAPGRYNSLYTGQIVGKGSYENCHSGTEAIKNDASFVSLLNASSAVPGYIWEVDSSNANDGYPVIKSCLSAMTNLSNSTDDMVIFHSSTFSASLSSTETGCTIYYTLDGTDPTTSSTRKTYSKAFTISGDTLVTSVAYKNGSYGVPTRQHLIQILGSGTTTSPYIISTNKQLYSIRFEPDKIYELTRDLDFTNEPKIYQGENWVSIPSFSGELRGNGHSITGLSSITGGLVGSNSGLIQELRLIDHQLCVSSVEYNPDNFGAIANNNSGTITRCYAGTDPNVTRLITVTTNDVGGIAGYNGGIISYCSSSGTLRAVSYDSYSWYSMGGIAGYNYRTIQSCYSDMKLYGAKTSHDLGAYISGIAFDGTVYDSRFDGHCSLLNTYMVSFGVGAGASHGDRGWSYRIYDGGATFSASPSSRVYYTQESDLYSYRGDKESSYPAFDFDKVWMMTSDGPMPQGVMRADGRCMAKYSYTEPTCTASGSAVSYDILNTSYRETETFSKLTHTYNVVVTDPTCTSVGCKTYTCSNCGDTYVGDEVAALGHSWGNVNCTTPKTCSTCGATEGTALGHSWINATCTISKTCSTCGATEGTALGHSWINATCTTPKTCSICGITEGAAHGHNWVSATCTTSKFCSTCSVIDGLPIGHNEVYQAAKAATCTMIGWQAYVTCSRCDYTTYVEIPATGHQPSDWIVDAAATYEKDGTKHKECTVCRVIIETSIVPMLKHSYVSTVTAPTCTEQGYTTHICTDCGNKYIDDYVYATGHYYGEWIQTIAPGNETTGQERRDCTVCDHYELQDIAPLGYSQVFIDAVMALPKYQSAEATYSELYSALQIYAKLTVEEKSEVNEYFLLLQELIESYNANATVVNTEAEKATEVAFVPIAMNFVFLAALWALLKKLLVK